MKQSRFKKEKIIGVLWEHEARVRAVDDCRKNCISETLFSKHKIRYGTRVVSTLCRLKGFSDPSVKLKQLQTEAMLHHAGLNASRPSRLRLRQVLRHPRRTSTSLDQKKKRNQTGCQYPHTRHQGRRCCQQKLAEARLLNLAKRYLTTDCDNQNNSTCTSGVIALPLRCRQLN